MRIRAAGSALDPPTRRALDADLAPVGTSSCWHPAPMRKAESVVLRMCDNSVIVMVNRGEAPGSPLTTMDATRVG